jgi:hypothetical protein
MPRNQSGVMWRKCMVKWIAQRIAELDLQFFTRVTYGGGGPSLTLFFEKLFLECCKWFAKTYFMVENVE